MMQRLECLRAIYDRLENCLVVTIMGAVAAELQSLGHRANFFYLQHAMGLGSSTGLGLFVSRAIIRTYGGELHQTQQMGECSFIVELPGMPVSQ